MKLTSIIAVIAATVSLVRSDIVVAAKPPLVLEPSSKWIVNYGEDSCRLLRAFGEGDDKVVATFDRFGPGEDFALILAGQPLKTSKASDASIQFGPSEAEQKRSFFIGSFSKGVPAILFQSNMHIGIIEDTKSEKQAAENWEDDYENSTIGPKREEAVNFFRIGKPLSTPVILNTGSMNSPLAALTKCTDGLIQLWGLDAEQHKNLTRKARPASNPGQWITSNNYPRGMLRDGQQSLVRFRIIIDEDGIPVACHIQQTTRAKEFDAAVCGSVMKRAKFIPALDSHSKAIKSYWRSTVRFQLP